MAAALVFVDSLAQRVLPGSNAGQHGREPADERRRITGGGRGQSRSLAIYIATVTVETLARIATLRQDGGIEHGQLGLLARRKGSIGHPGERLVEFRQAPADIAK